jgi:hypothetical protein
MTEAMREQFEAWAIERDWPVDRDEDGGYVDSFTECAWQGYQAALRSPAVAGLVEAAKVAADGFESVGMDFSATALRAALAQYATLAGESHD